MPDPATQTSQVTQEIPVAQPVQATPVQPISTEPKKEELIKRAASFKPAPTDAKPADSTFDFKAYQDYVTSVQDPTARKFIEDAYKSMTADYTRKMQPIAAQGKEVETLKQQLEQLNRFTPERIQELLSNPTFVQAAQEHVRKNSVQPTNGNGNGSSTDLTDEEFSYLSPEQQKMYQQQKQTQGALASLQSELTSMRTQKEDTELSSRYPNYDTTQVNKIFSDMMTGKVQATREHLWKVVDYEDAVHRAYSMGRSDERDGVTEKRNASAIGGGVNAAGTQADIPSQQKGESFQAYWRRLASQAKVSLGVK